MRHGFRPRVSPSKSELAAILRRRWSACVANAKRIPRILKMNGTFYANDVAMKQLKEQLKPVDLSPHRDTIFPFMATAGVPIERMPEWMEAAAIEKHICEGDLRK